MIYVPFPALSSQDWNSWETAQWACDMTPTALCPVPSAAVLKVDFTGWFLTVSINQWLGPLMES